MNTKPSVVFSDSQRMDFPSIGLDRYLRNLRSAGWTPKEFGGPLLRLSGFDPLTEHAAAVFMRRPCRLTAPPAEQRSDLLRFY